MKDLTISQKYDFYEAAVQSAENEVEFMEKEFLRIRGREPKTMREDFCGTGAITCLWGSRPGKKSWGVDLDPEPIEEGKRRHYDKLTPEQKLNIEYVNKDVLEFDANSDVVCAFNFSYFIFKEREKLIRYFKSVRDSLSDDGLFFMDIFGGPDSMIELEEEQEKDGFDYFWDCQMFNPLTHDCRFAIHFKPDNGPKYENVFVYNWRFWTVPEICEMLLEAGFKEAKTYWEGDDDEEDEDDEVGGNGEFFETRYAENCEAWVIYIVGVK